MTLHSKIAFFKYLSDQVWMIYQCLKFDFFKLRFRYNSNLRISVNRKHEELSESNTWKPRKTTMCSTTLSKFNEFKPLLKFPKNRFQLSAGLNLEKLNTIFKWNQPKLNRGLNLSCGSNSLNSAWDKSFQESRVLL